MTNVTSLDKVRSLNVCKKKGIIAMDNEEAIKMFEAFFKIPMRIFNVEDDKGFLMGYSAAPGDPEDGTEVIDYTVTAWHMAFAGRVFYNAHSILITFMDCYLEQVDIHKSIEVEAMKVNLVDVLDLND